MINKIFYTILFLLAFSLAARLSAQENMNRNWDSEKIKGTRQLPYPLYHGFPYLTKNWMPGEIEFNSGEIVDSLNFRYSSYKDELVYFNQAINTQITIDKSDIKGFSFVDENGSHHIFRKFFYNDFMKGYHYFEVLSEGESDLLVYRKVNLNTVSPYKDERGVLTNMEYVPEYRYYFYTPEKGFTGVKPNQMGLVSKFVKTDQKLIRKLLRKNKISITDESGLVKAWKAIEKEGYKVVF